MRYPSILIIAVVSLLFLAGCTEAETGSAVGNFPDLYNAYEDLGDFLAEAGDAVNPALLPIGILLLVRGWQVYDWLYLIPGMIIGGLVAYGLATDNIDDEGGVIVATIFGGLLGALGAGLIHGFSVWLLMWLLAAWIITEVWRDIFGEPIETPLGVFATFIGSFYLVWAYNRLAGLVAALLGAVMISDFVGISGNTILLVALIGFWIQSRSAKASKKDVFRRKNYDPDKQPTRQSEPPSRRTYRQPDNIDDFTIPVVEGRPMPRFGLFGTYEEYPQDFDQYGNPKAPYKPIDHKPKRQLWDALEE